MRIIGRFAKDTSGNFAVTTALCATVVITAMGGSLDAWMAFREGTRLQAAVDAAALAVARRPLDMKDNPQKVADDFFLANFKRKVVVNLKVTKDLVVADAATEVGTSFLGVTGIKVIPVSRHSEVSLAINTREVALVMDTTGSMAGKKITDMKSAVTRIVKDLADAGKAQGTPTKFSLVPFAPMVNVGYRSGTTPWDFVDQTGASNPVMGDIPRSVSRFSLYAHLGRQWGGCVESRPNGLDVTDAAPDASKPDTMFVPSFVMDEPDSTYSGYFAYPNNYLVDNDGSKRLFALANNWIYNGKSANTGTILGDVLAIGKKANGRFVDGDHPLARYGVKFDLQGNPLPPAAWTKPTMRPSYRYLGSLSIAQGPDAQCVSDPLIPLTTDDAKVSNAVKALTAEGATNIVEGVAWGWRTLSPGKPFTEGRPYDDRENDKIMILLTDGSNDLTSLSSIPGNEKGSFYSSYGYVNDGVLQTTARKVPRSAAETKAAMDARVLAICSNAKKEGIQIFTILLEVEDAGTSTMLRDCATTPDRFYDTRDSSRLAAVFEDIKGKISKMHISK